MDYFETTLSILNVFQGVFKFEDIYIYIYIATYIQLIYLICEHISVS